MQRINSPSVVAASRQSAAFRNPRLERVGALPRDRVGFEPSGLALTRGRQFTMRRLPRTVAVIAVSLMSGVAAEPRALSPSSTHNKFPPVSALPSRPDCLTRWLCWMAAGARAWDLQGA
ncbi:MAG: hypothetical protein AB9869_34790 [Verrucomicrobiia bacterium]